MLPLRAIHRSGLGSNSKKKHGNFFADLLVGILVCKSVHHRLCVDQGTDKVQKTGLLQEEKRQDPQDWQVEHPDDSVGPSPQQGHVQRVSVSEIQVE
jgi:hypothetical protein